MFEGQSIRLIPLNDGFIEMCFDRQNDVINKLDELTLSEMGNAVRAIAANTALRGILITSAKQGFVVGADIREFDKTFRLTAAGIVAHFERLSGCVNDLEDLGLPSVVAINGFALGGGLELAMVGAFRVMADNANVGLPEVKLGLFPGMGGTVRAPRLAGAASAVQLISSGRSCNATEALALHLVDEICPLASLHDIALALLGKAASGELDWRTRQAKKRLLPADEAEQQRSAIALLKTDVAKRSPKHQPAALAAVELMEKTIGLDRDTAIKMEREEFARIAKTQAADALVQAFNSSQVLKKLFRQHAANARPVKQAAILGAGIMGGGIAYTSALRGTPVRMKDIAQTQLDLGMSEAVKQLARQVKSGRLDAEKAAVIHQAITPQLDYAGFDGVDIVIEAVVENLGVKHRVLIEVEKAARADTVIASNTSSMRIDDLATPLARPDNFVGMHFFNPVPAMTLVEVIRGGRTSDVAVSTAVAYAVAMGKTPIVVKDCPGFLVNRILTPYGCAFLRLISDGADFVEVDRVMEAFGWPMGPAYLQDVVGMDVGAHVQAQIVAGYPQRMRMPDNNALSLMVANKRYGQKNGVGFYRYETDPQGKPRKSVAADSHALLASVQKNGRRTFSDQEIVERMMLPVIMEAVRTLDEGVVATPVELDMALVLGIGFPAYAGGALKYADWLGLAHVVSRCDHYATTLGADYLPTDSLRAMAAQGRKFYGD